MADGLAERSKVFALLSKVPGAIEAYMLGVAGSAGRPALEAGAQASRYLMGAPDRVPAKYVSPMAGAVLEDVAGPGAGSAWDAATKFVSPAPPAWADGDFGKTETYQPPDASHGLALSPQAQQSLEARAAGSAVAAPKPVQDSLDKYLPANQASQVAPDAPPDPNAPGEAVILRGPDGKITLTNLAQRHPGLQKVSGLDARLAPDSGGPVATGLSGPPAPGFRRMGTGGMNADGSPEIVSVPFSQLPSTGGASADKPIMDIETMPPGQRPDSYWEDKAKEMALAEFAAKKAMLERDKNEPMWRERRKAGLEVEMAGEKKRAEEQARYGPVDALVKQRFELSARLDKATKEIEASNATPEKKAALLAEQTRRLNSEMEQLDKMIGARTPRYEAP